VKIIAFCLLMGTTFTVSAGTHVSGTSGFTEPERARLGHRTTQLVKYEAKVSDLFAGWFMAPLNQKEKRRNKIAYELREAKIRAAQCAEADLVSSDINIQDRTMCLNASSFKSFLRSTKIENKAVQSRIEKRAKKWEEFLNDYLFAEDSSNETNRKIWDLANQASRSISFELDRKKDCKFNIKNVTLERGDVTADALAYVSFFKKGGSLSCLKTRKDNANEVLVGPGSMLVEFDEAKKLKELANAIYEDEGDNKQKEASDQKNEEVASISCFREASLTVRQDTSATVLIKACGSLGLSLELALRKQKADPKPRCVRDGAGLCIVSR